MTWDDAITEINDTHASKGQDYGTDEDPYANVRSSERLGIPAWVEGCALVAHKTTRIGSFLRRGKLNHESARDSLLDQAVYAVIALVLFDEAEEEGWGA